MCTLAPMSSPSVGLSTPGSRSRLILPPGRTSGPVEIPLGARRRSGRSALDPTPWIVGAITLVLRIATAAHGPTDWDSAQYAAAVGHFDVTHGQPQPPGYWLYVEAGRLLKEITGLGTIHSLVAVSALASAAAVGMTVAAGRAIGGRWLGVAAGAIVATSPFVWFSGSTVATYSFDALACAALVLMAWSARPGSLHGVAAVVTLGLLAGFRPSAVQSFAILVLLAVAGATRSWRQLAVTVGAGVLAVAVWFIPMVTEQAGGVTAWVRATRIEAAGALQVTSIFDNAGGGRTNLGTFAAYTALSLGPVAVLAIAAGAVLGVRHLFGSGQADRHGAAESDQSGSAGSAIRAAPVDVASVPTWIRPWYQRRATVLAAAIVPPAALVSLVEFAKGGYLLAYLPAAVIALLLPTARLLHRGAPDNQFVAGPHRTSRRPAPTGSPMWLALLSLAVVAIVAVGAERFLAGEGVLPLRWLRPSGGLWIQQAQYQAPYADTRSTITTTDAIDAALSDLQASVGGPGDVVVFDSLDGGANYFRNAGWSLPDVRIALVSSGAVLYNEIHGALYYASGATVAAGPSGSVFLVASPTLPGLASLVARGDAISVATPMPIGHYLVWRLLPGSTVIGVRAVSSQGARPLGRGI